MDFTRDDLSRSSRASWNVKASWSPTILGDVSHVSSNAKIIALSIISDSSKNVNRDLLGNHIINKSYS
jgi:hypothetical protein